MAELIARTEAIDHLQHHGKTDPNLVIYDAYANRGDAEKARLFLEYRRQWEAVRRGEDRAEYPLFVTFGLNDSCNLLCAHCYRRFNKDRSSKRFLEKDEIFALIDQCVALGVPSLGFGTESEALLHKDIRAVLSYVSRKDFRDVFLFTNGILLDGDMVETILESNVTRLSVSLDAVTERTYRKVRGDCFQKVMANVSHFLERRKTRKTMLPILRVSFVKSNLNEGELDSFLGFWRPLADEVDVQPLIDVKNVDALRHSTAETVRCDYPNNMLYIKWDGDYKPCCSEFCKHLTVGNIKNMSILEAWNSEFMTILRKELAGEKQLNKVCVNCMSSLRSSEKYEPIEATNDQDG